MPRKDVIWRVTCPPGQPQFWVRAVKGMRWEGRGLFAIDGPFIKGKKGVAREGSLLLLGWRLRGERTPLGRLWYCLGQAKAGVGFRVGEEGVSLDAQGIQRIADNQVEMSPQEEDRVISRYPELAPNLGSPSFPILAAAAERLVPRPAPAEGPEDLAQALGRRIRGLQSPQSREEPE